MKEDLLIREKMAVEEHEKLSPRLVYEIIRKGGIEELQRPAKALIFSGITAGLLVTCSFIFKAILSAYLPSDSTWSYLIENMGYAVGFVIVILGHMQLFTENPISTVIPLFNPFTIYKLNKVLRLWGIVLLSNMVGTAFAASFILIPHVFNDTILNSLNQIAHHVADYSAFECLIKGIPAGILIAALVWMMPSANSKFTLIFFMTYLIAIGDFTHVVVGSAEMAYWVFSGHASIVDYFAFVIPTCIGNIIGGAGVFTLLIYGQVNEEL